MNTQKYTLPEKWIQKVCMLSEFANGGAQVSIRTKDGKTWNQILSSNSTWIIAMRGYDDLPFSISEIEDIYQAEADKNPKERGNWKFWNTDHQGIKNNA